MTRSPRQRPKSHARSIPIPREIQRQLRREAGFGCCFCGCPIVDYHHIKGYQKSIDAGEYPHDPADMMVVCTMHHRLITNGSISESKQRERKRIPEAHLLGRTEGEFYFPVPPQFRLGTLRSVGWFYIRVDLKTVIAIETDQTGQLQLSLRIHDSNGKEDLVIRRNRWFADPGSASLWDIEFIGRRLKIKRGLGKPILEVEANETYGGVVYVRGHLAYMGTEIEMSERHVLVRSSTTTIHANQEGVQMNRVGIQIDSKTGRMSFHSDYRAILDV